MENEDNIIVLPVITRLDVEPDRVLKAAIGEVEKIVLIGWDKDDKFYFASSIAGGEEILWLLRIAEKNLLRAYED